MSKQMKLKKSNSMNQQPNNIEDIQVSIQQPHPAARSENVLSLTAKNRQRVPLTLQSVLRQRMSQQRSAKHPEDDKELKKNKLSNAIRNKVRNAKAKIMDMRNCEICEGEITKVKGKKEVYLCDCEHKKNFCESCLHHYVLYKVNTFEEVLCPHQGCSGKLDPSSGFFKALPLDVQKNYKKIYTFFMVSKDPNLKICPREDCQGVIRSIEDNTMVCDICEGSFCATCLLTSHSGQCDPHEVQFFESNLHYRQCKKCKFIIEKDQGCNHMTCKCGYQFCYVCGDKWTSIHYNNHDANGRPVVNGDEPYDEDCNCDCGCIDQCCGQTLGSIIKLPIKLFLLLLFIPMMILLWLSRDFFVIIGMFIVSIISGLFGFSFQILSQLQGIVCLLGVLFFPITMICGVGKAFRDVFCDVVPDLTREFCEVFSNGVTGICNI